MGLRYNLLGQAFTFCLDHAPLQWFRRMKDAHTQITRCYLVLHPFKFEIVHRLGVQMAVKQKCKIKLILSNLINIIVDHAKCTGSTFNLKIGLLNINYHFHESTSFNIKLGLRQMSM